MGIRYGHSMMIGEYAGTAVKHTGITAGEHTGIVADKHRSLEQMLPIPTIIDSHIAMYGYNRWSQYHVWQASTVRWSRCCKFYRDSES